MFEHKFYKTYDLERVDTENGRKYRTPSGNLYYSVTTILEKLSRDKLAKWRENVGEKTANKIRTQAARRGSAVHSICEKYLLNEQDYCRGAMPSNVDMFNQIKPIITENIQTVFGVELMMYSDQLKAAGTTDCLCSWNGKPTIVDFKTSRYNKTEDMITNYFLQASAYSIMAKELYNCECQQIVIIIGVDHEQPQVICKDPAEYYPAVFNVFSGN